MPEILNHCQQVPLAQPGPCEVDIQSAQGPGTVEVTGPNGVPVYGVVNVPPGGTVIVKAAGTVEVHYTQGAGGPPSIEAEIQQILT